MFNEQSPIDDEVKEINQNLSKSDGIQICVCDIKTSHTHPINDIETSFIEAVYGAVPAPTFRLRRNVVNRHRE